MEQLHIVDEDGFFVAVAEIPVSWLSPWNIRKHGPRWRDVERDFLIEAGRAVFMNEDGSIKPGRERTKYVLIKHGPAFFTLPGVRDLREPATAKVA